MKSTNFFDSRFVRLICAFIYFYSRFLEMLFIGQKNLMHYFATIICALFVYKYTVTSITETRKLALHTALKIINFRANKFVNFNLTFLNKFAPAKLN